MPFMPTSSTGTQNPFLNPVSAAPSSGGGQYDTLFDPNSWLGDSKDSIDSMRHFGGLGMAGLQNEFKGQLGDVAGGIDQQRNALSQLNKLGSPAGQAERVGSFQNDALARAKAAGKKLRASILARTGSDIGGAADLLSTNMAMMQTGDFASWLSGPEGQGQIAQALMAANSPTNIMSLLPILMQMNDQDFQRVNLHEQLAAQDAGGDFGKVLGSLGMLLGQSSGIPGLGGRGKGGGNNPMSILLSGNGNANEA